MKSKTFKPFYGVSGLEVSDTGVVRRRYKDKSFTTGWSPYKYLQYKYDNAKNKYVLTRDKGRLRVDYLVAKCFVHKPSIKHIFVIHQDKNKENCCKENLRWATVYLHGEFYKDDPYVNTSDGYRLVAEDLYVSKEGLVKDANMTPLSIYNSFFDEDLGKEVSCRPYISREINERIYVEELVAEAFLEKPDLPNLVLVHKDDDKTNCKLDNLEWKMTKPQRL